MFHLVEVIQSKHNKRHQFEFELYSFILGLFLFPLIDVEEGKRVARQADIDAGLYSEEE